jgi:hypothetical protein
MGLVAGHEKARDAVVDLGQKIANRWPSGARAYSE